MSMKGFYMIKEKLGYSAVDLEKLGLGSRNHIYKQIEQGVIPHVALGNRKIVPKWWVDKCFNVQNLEVSSGEDEVFNRAS